MKQRTKALLAGVISGAAFAGLVGGLILWLPSYKQKKEMEAIKPVETAAPIIEEPEATPDPATEEAAQRAKYADLIARNSDFAGWIEIPGVDIDLPILQTTDNYFYLYHDLDRADDKRGMPFADYECDMKTAATLSSTGITWALIIPTASPTCKSTAMPITTPRTPTCSWTRCTKARFTKS